MIISVEKCSDVEDTVYDAGDILDFINEYISKKHEKLEFMDEDNYKKIFKFVIFSEYCLQDKGRQSCMMIALILMTR